MHQTGSLGLEPRSSVHIVDPGEREDYPDLLGLSPVGDKGLQTLPGPQGEMRDSWIVYEAM